MYSDDEGKSWAQAEVPVSSDLLALHFPSARQGWAVGHEGVVLHTSDGGVTWSKQLDGRAIGELMLSYYEPRAKAGDAKAADMLREAEAFAAQGPDKPFLDVWFEDEQKGFVVGAFNLILRTEDGGQSWTPWLDRVDNSKAYHLYAIRPAAGTLFIVGEQGLVLKLDRDAQRFASVALPYEGTLFGVLGTSSSTVVFGLRGNAFRSTDGGGSWQKLDTGVSSGLSAGIARADGAYVLVSQAGQVLLGSAHGITLRKVPLDMPMPAFAVAEAGVGRIAIAGARGVRLEALK